MSISDVARSNEHGEAEPEHECIDSKEGTVVKQDASPAYECCDNTE